MMAASDRVVDSEDAPEALTIAVLSDLHIHHDEKTYQAESNYVRNMADKSPRNNPVVGLKEVLDRHVGTIDFLICCGDITDKAHPGALDHGWEVLRSIGKSLGARGVFASAGNHDLDSRYSFADFDAKGVAMRLKPDFPVADRALANAYWARHYCIIRGGNYQFVLLNSAAYHGEGRAFASVGGKAIHDTPEYLHGRVSSHTLESLYEDLAHKAMPLNILVCHHHPTRIDAVPDDEYSAMQNGEGLVQLLSRPEMGQWLILHGHRHVAAIQRPGGDAPNSGPLCFCAGSFGKVLPPRWPSANQFYVLEVLTNPATIGQALAGRFRSWSWSKSTGGWERAGFKEKLPGVGGFGFVGDLRTLAGEVVQVLDSGDTPSLTLEELCGRLPKVRYLAPGDWDHLRQHLNDAGVRVLEDTEDGEIEIVGR